MRPASSLFRAAGLSSSATPSSLLVHTFWFLCFLLSFLQFGGSACFFLGRGWIAFVCLGRGTIAFVWEGARGGRGVGVNGSFSLFIIVIIIIIPPEDVVWGGRPEGARGQEDVSQIFCINSTRTASSSWFNILVLMATNSVIVECVFDCTVDPAGSEWQLGLAVAGAV